jgi:hypothetical protein
MAAMLEESAVGEAAGSSPAGEILAGRWAFGLGSALLLLLAAVEGAHWQAMSRHAAFEQVVQQPAAISSPASHPDVSAPDPGDNP